MIKLLEWLATALVIAGAVFSSLDWYPLNIIAFNVGSLVWLFVAIRIKMMSLVVVNGGLVLIYLAGILRSIDI